MMTITESALIQRLNRKLGKDCEKVCKSRPRPSGTYNELGDYYIKDFYRNVIINYGLSVEDLVDIATECGAMHESEKLIDP